MKVKLRAFDDKCPKCLCVAGQRWHCPGCKAVKRPDHLHCICSCCGFEWTAKCADSIENKDQKPGGGKHDGSRTA